MSNKFFIERRPQGDYAVRREGADRASTVTDTQRQAIDWVKERHPTAKPDVERVRHTDRGRPDHWRGS